MAHLYWRLFFPTNFPGQSRTSVAICEMRSTIGGPNVATGGTASASSQLSGTTVAANAFDGDVNTRWESSTGAGPHWLMYQFAAPVDIVELALRPDGTLSPISPPGNFTLQSSDDGLVWNDVATFENVRPWSGGETRLYQVGVVPRIFTTMVAGEVLLQEKLPVRVTMVAVEVLASVASSGGQVARRRPLIISG